MPGFVVGGGKVDAEGFLKFLLMMVRQGYAQGLNVTQRGSGANMSVDVNLGTAGYAGAMLSTSANVPYFGWIGATENVSVNASDPTNPRIDTVVAYVDLSVISTSITDNTGAFKFKAVPGTPAGSPSAPSGATIQTSIGAGNPYVSLGNLAVAANAASIVNANITDIRNPMAFQVPYLYGGNLNTNGHLVPNVADSTLALLGAAQTFTGNQTFSGQVNIGGFNIAGAWQSWTPTWTGLTAGNGTNSATYQQVGKTVNFQILFTLGSTSSVASGVITFTLPFTASSFASGSNKIIPLGAASFNHSGVAVYAGSATIENSTTVGTLRRIAADPDQLGSLSSTLPFTWTSGDVIGVRGSYEAL